MTEAPPFSLAARLRSFVYAGRGIRTMLISQHEFLCDVASPEFHPLVEKAKDVAACAILLSALGAALIGGLVFAPHLS